MRQILLHPEIVNRSCKDCQEFMYLDNGTEMGEPMYRAGERVRRPNGTKPPCWKCPKQPGWVPQNQRQPATAVEMSSRSWEAWTHYQECFAVGEFPADPWVREHAGMIRQLVDSVRHNELVSRLELVARVSGLRM